MSNNDEKITAKTQYFDLRERRLKLVYKILYVVVAIWIAIVLSATQNTLEMSEIPVYSFVLSSASMTIIQIIKYTIMEFRCMKVVGHLSEDLMRQTELRYDNIWKSFSLILSLCGLALILHCKFVEQLNATFFMILFSVCISYFTVISFIKLFKQSFSDGTMKVLDIIGIIAGSIAAYSLCTGTFLITSATVTS